MAIRDANRIPAIHASLNTDTSQDVNIVADSSTHALRVNMVDESTDTRDIAIRDANYVPALLAVSSEDGETPVALSANASGALLIQTD